MAVHDPTDFYLNHAWTVSAWVKKTAPLRPYHLGVSKVGDGAAGKYKVGRCRLTLD